MLKEFVDLIAKVDRHGRDGTAFTYLSFQEEQELIDLGYALDLLASVIDETNSGTIGLSQMLAERLRNLQTRIRRRFEKYEELRRTADAYGRQTS